jgi:hypothetical protein
MEHRHLLLWCGTAAIVILLLTRAAAAGPAGLVGYWTFDEGEGTIAHDSSGNGLDGTLRGSPNWVAGAVGGALDFDGSSDYVEIPDSPLLSLTNQITIAAWTHMRTNASGEMAILSKGGWGANDLPYELTEENGAVIFWQFYDNEGRDTCSPASPPPGEWHHIAATYDGQVFKCYVDGVLGEQFAYAGQMPKNTASVTIGRRSRGGTFFNGMIDDVQLWERALSEVEVGKIMTGLVDAALAQDPSPEDLAADVPVDVAMSWTPGETAAAHDVYLGTAFADVNEAGRDAAVLVSREQADARYDPEGPLEYGTTYYWRIDEVNAAPDSTIFKGQTWTFTTEPYGYPLANVTATASGSQPGMGPENTVDGSGLDDLDQHSTNSTDMWMSDGGKPAWIQFEFDAVYALHELWVWNSNQLVEGFLGLGAKDVTIEYSADGQTWTALEAVPQFARATGAPTYAADTKVAFNGATAKYVKLTIENNWGGALPSTGLSEVRFFYIPMQAFRPQPADEATAVSIDAELSWRPGRTATSHTVFLGTDETAVAGGTAPAETVAEHSYTPASLDLATRYFWKVDETSDGGAYAGAVWSFTTEEFAAIDDFESYNDDIDAETTIWQAWVDGVTTKSSGSQAGYTESPFAERSIVHGGRQAMPLIYDNSASPYYSEAERTFDPQQDWTAHAADTLCVYFRGAADNSPEGLYVTLKDNSKSATVAYSDAAATTAAEWRKWTIPLADFAAAGVKTTAVKALVIGVGNRTAPASGGTGTVYIDDIGYGRLLPSQ